MVVLIDGDLRRGILHRLVGQPRGPGLAELLSGKADFSQAVYDTTAPNLRLIPTGTLPSNPSELVSEERLSTLPSKLESEYELVVFDSPPVLAASEAILLARAAEVSLMVVRSQQQVRREIETAMKRLQQGGGQLRGLVFNDVKVRWRNYYDYYGQWRATKAIAASRTASRTVRSSVSIDPVERAGGAYRTSAQESPLGHDEVVDRGGSKSRFRALRRRL